MDIVYDESSANLTCYTRDLVIGSGASFYVTAHCDYFISYIDGDYCHTYNHLTEQPTLFYAVAAVIAISGTGDGANAMIAWAYVALRVLHSLVQATVNRVWPRFMLFLASTLALAALTLHAAMAVF